MEHIGKLEKRLWSSADVLRTASNFASNEYFMPVMGLIFLRHACSRYLKVRDEILPTLPSRGGKTRELTKGDFSSRSAIFLRHEAQFDYLVSLPEDHSSSAAVIHAMETIEEDYENLTGLLPKMEYEELDEDALRQVLRIFNDPALQKADGDVFGRIYEYFLTQFALRFPYKIIIKMWVVYVGASYGLGHNHGTLTRWLVAIVEVPNLES